MSTSDIILNIEAIPLDGNDLVTMSTKMGMPNVAWILYDDLAKVKKIEDLFLGDTVALFVLLEIVNPGSSNVGHWIALILDRNFQNSPPGEPSLSNSRGNFGGRIIHYDSYGFNIDQETSITGQDKGLLKNLLDEAQGRNSTDELKHDVSKYPHQSNDERDNVNTCGRFCVIRAVFYQLTNKQFNDLIIMPPIKDKLIANPDVLVAALTSFLVDADHNQHLELLRRLEIN